MQFNPVRFFGSAVTTATLVLAYFLSGRNLMRVFDSLIAALVVAAVIAIIVGYARLISKDHYVILRVMILLTALAVAALVALFLRTSFGSVAWHWFLHLSTGRGWLTALVLVAGYTFAWFTNKVQQRSSQHAQPAASE